MSLLIKALHKAEQGKVSDNKTAKADLLLELMPVGEPAPASIVQQQHSGQKAATTMFASKNTQVNTTRSKRIWLIAGIGLLVLALIAMQFYSYLNSLNQPQLAVRPAPVPPLTQTVSPPANSTNNLAQTTPASMPAPVPTLPAATVQAVEKPVVTAKLHQTSPVADIAIIDKVAASEQLRQRRPKPAKSEQLSYGEPVPASENSTVKITRNNPATGINPALLAAYQAFNVGDDATAQRNYRQVLQSDVRSVDALLGMAAIALRQGRSNDAAGWYGKVLEVEPKNNTAQAAMISAYSQADPVGSESRIKSLLAQQPEAANLYAALGSLYIEQSQWPAAQQAYFQAHHFDPDNADYAFNLAISLDQLGKSALALQYYKQALELLTRFGGSIDRAQLESRIAQLQ